MEKKVEEVLRKDDLKLKEVIDVAFLQQGQLSSQVRKSFERVVRRDGFAVEVLLGWFRYDIIHIFMWNESNLFTEQQKAHFMSNLLYRFRPLLTNRNIFAHVNDLLPHAYQECLKLAEKHQNVPQLFVGYSLMAMAIAQKPLPQDVLSLIERYLQNLPLLEELKPSMKVLNFGQLDLSRKTPGPLKLEFMQQEDILHTRSMQLVLSNLNIFPLHELVVLLRRLLISASRHAQAGFIDFLFMRIEELMSKESRLTHKVLDSLLNMYVKRMRFSSPFLDFLAKQTEEDLTLYKDMPDFCSTITLSRL